MVFVYIIIAIIAFIALWWLFKAWLFKRELVKEFRRCNVIVAGKKGAGKDLLFQEIIRKRKEPYYANINYGGKCTLVSPKEISVEPNTYENFIKGEVHEVQRVFKERTDFYISDGGIFLPSYMDSTLYKTFKSLPIFYALSRHLCAANVHVNVQNFGRLWKALREQADSYVLVKRTISLPRYLLVRATIYDNYESAEQKLEPMKKRWFNKYSKTEYDLYEAQHGYIKKGWVIIKKKNIKYDTRAFEKIIYGEQPRIKQR